MSYFNLNSERINYFLFKLLHVIIRFNLDFNGCTKIIITSLGLIDVLESYVSHISSSSSRIFL